MPLLDFYNSLWKKEHVAYKDSILSSVAPEYTTGEVLLGAMYRKLLLGKQEANVDLKDIDTLPDRLAPQQQEWKSILKSKEGLASPSLSGQGSTPPPQLMPLVPEIARYGCVLGGRPRSRWDPGNLLLSTLGSGLGPIKIKSIIDRLQKALEITDQEDVFARFVEISLAPIANDPQTRPSIDHLEELTLKLALAWRNPSDLIRTPAEQFSRDLKSIIGLKERLTRRQWTVLFEALLRVGLATHMLWLCRANKVVWHMVLDVIESNSVPDALAIEERCWEGYDNVDPLLELGRDGIPFIKKRLQEFIQARLGLNLLLHALEDAGCGWPNPIGVSQNGNLQPAPELIAKFLCHVKNNRAPIQQIVKKTFDDEPSLRSAAQTIADSNPRLLGSLSGPTKNLYEFLRYSLGQLQPMESEMNSYDQSYILYKKNRRQRNSPWLVQPGPAALILLVHSCCKSLGKVPASIDDFRNYLANYGILAPAGELQGGQTGRDLERLGLVVDSPDAGGGRLLVDPFSKRSA